jgi:hypothetical protein
MRRIDLRRTRLSRRVGRIAQRSAAPRTAGRLTAGKSPRIADGEQNADRDFPKVETACAASHTVATAHSPMR